MLGNTNNSYALVRNRKANRAVVAHRTEVQMEVSARIAETEGRQAIVEHELDVNAMVVSRATANEMNVAEHMIARAGTSQLAQAIAADRMNRLMQADNRTLSRGGF